jgi:transmembrane sensor
MKTKNIYPIDWALVTKYLSGNAKESEKNTVLEWANATIENKTAFDRAEKLWNASKSANISDINVNDAWNKVNERANVRSQTKTRALTMPQKYILRIAAVLVIGLVSWYYISNSVIEKSFSTSTEIAQLNLSDGSEIALNKGAIINYPEKFSGETREIKMNGEAYFNIAKNAAKPFIIHTSNADIKVLGTSFNVISKPNGDLEVVVNTGVVSVTSTKTNEQVILHKDEKASYLTSNASLLKTVNTDVNYLSWNTRKFVFRESTLSNVFENIEKVYGIKIIADERIMNCKLTATYDRLDVKQIIHLIDMTFGFKTVENNNVYLVEGISCAEK